MGVVVVFVFVGELSGLESSMSSSSLNTEKGFDVAAGVMGGGLGGRRFWRRAKNLVFDSLGAATFLFGLFLLAMTVFHCVSGKVVSLVVRDFLG